MRNSPQDLKLAQACELGDEDTFRALLANRRISLRHYQMTTVGSSRMLRKTTMPTPLGSCFVRAGRWTQGASTA
jgi:hypothetical protein